MQPQQLLLPNSQFCFPPWRPPLAGVPLRGAQQWYVGTTQPALAYARANRVAVTIEDPWGYVGQPPAAAPVLITAKPPPCGGPCAAFTAPWPCGTCP
jgi:hypothetical protein